MATKQEALEYRLIVQTLDPECCEPTTVFVQDSPDPVSYVLNHFQWLNGDHVEITLNNDETSPLETNRPVDDPDTYMHPEDLYDEGNSYLHPYNEAGYLRLLVNGRETEVCMTVRRVGSLPVALEDESRLIAA